MNIRVATGLLALFAVLASGTAASACNVPVFRYALERWSPDPYQIIIFHKGPLAEEDQRLVKWVEHYGDRDIPGLAGAANLTVQTCDTTAFMASAHLWANPLTRAFLSTMHHHDRGPWMVVRFPESTQLVEDVWTASFTLENVKALLVSRARQELTRRLVSGQSGVWVFIESGDGAKDAAALATLRKELKHLEKTLELPELSNTPRDKLLNTQVALRIEFSVLTLSRTDPREVPLVRMLLNMEEDLWKKEPVVFPVFGRGIALYAIVGKGIHPDPIARAAEFLVGKCSCGIKKFNPGKDLLVTADWDEAIREGTVTPEPEPTPVRGLSDIPVPQTKVEKKTAASEPKQPKAPRTSSPDSPSPVDAGDGAWTLTRNLLFAVLAGLVLVGTLSFLIRDKKNGKDHQ